MSKDSNNFKGSTATNFSPGALVLKATRARRLPGYHQQR
jgi:hypothetical protein